MNQKVPLPARFGRTKRRFLTKMYLLGASFAGSPVLADEKTSIDTLGDEIRELRGRLEELELRYHEESSSDPSSEAPPWPPTILPGPSDRDDANSSDDESPIAELTPPWSRDELETPRSLRGVYDKPFLASLWRRVHLGGYTELEYHSFEDGVLGIPEGFRMHRTNLFLFAEIADRVRFGSELEFETEFDGDEERATRSRPWSRWPSLTGSSLRGARHLRGGAIVVPPLGRVNVNHDGPVRELDRPAARLDLRDPDDIHRGGSRRRTVRLRLSDVVQRWATRSYAVNGFEHPRFATATSSS